MEFKILLLILLLEFTSAQIDDQKCDAQLKYYSDSLAAREAWAVEFFDTWTKFQTGISSGNRVDLGHYDQCVEFRHKSSENDVGEIQGQHCMIFYRASANASTGGDENFNWPDIGSELRAQNLRLGGGYCLPATCSTKKVRSFIGEFLAPADLIITSDYDQSMFCRTNDSIPLETIDVVAIVISSLLLLFLITSTIYEIVTLQRDRKPHELFSAFSVLKNGKKLFDTSRGKSSSIIHCLPGLRALSMFHIMLGHRYLTLLNIPGMNSNYFMGDGAWQQTLWSAVVNVHPIAVDCFFVIGGCLLARSALKAIEIKNYNIPKMYLHRYLRVMPLLGFLILFILSLYKYLGSGPYYNFVQDAIHIDHCEKYWWTSLLHIANYYNPGDVCLAPSWYLAVDFQLVLLSPLIMYPAYKWGWRFLWLLPVYVITTVVWPFVGAMMNDYKAVALLMSTNLRLESKRRFYYVTHIRMGPWLIGVILGYIFYKLNNRKIAINKFLNTLLWILSLGTLFAILFGLLPLQSVDNPASQVAHAFFFAMQRNSWGLAIAWIIFSCEMGGGGIVKKFLELPLWRPLGRMSLSFYLVHTLYITAHAGSSRTPYWYNDAHMLHIVAGDMLINVVFATILYLTFEEPFLLIENYFYKLKAASSRKSVEQTC